MHKEWLEFAAMDLDSAQFLLGMRPVPVEIICYHCEQAAEKLLKAVLVAADVEPPKTHDLIQLCKKCAELDEEYEALADSCIELSPYGVQVRYSCPATTERNGGSSERSSEGCKTRERCQPPFSRCLGSGKKRRTGASIKISKAGAALRKQSRPMDQSIGKHGINLRFPML